MYPYALKGAIVEALCACFWYHDALRGFMLECGVPERYYDAQVERGGTKRSYLKQVTDDLAGKGRDGHSLLNRIARQLSLLTGPEHPEKLEHEAAQQALSKLRLLAAEAGLTANEPKKQEQPRLSDSQREVNLEASRRRFYDMTTAWTGTPQQRGYAFQDLLKDMFDAHGLEYQPPFRGNAQETDGMFTFDGRRFHVEARWRKDEADFNALSHFHSKLVTKFSGTVGLFVSMEGFEPDAVAELAKLGESRFLLLPGMEFVKIVEQRVSLPEALRQMVNAAHKYGVVLVELN
jgi:hypothetical protein